MSEAQLPTIVTDDGPLSSFLDTGKFNQLYRVADMFSKSDLVPQHFQGKPANCMIAIEMAVRMGLAPMMFMQNSYLVHGNPGIESKLAIALINSSGLFKGNLEYERSGDDPHDENYKVRAFAIRKDTKKAIYGPWIDWNMVNAEGWSKEKKGQKSKWVTMPGLMFDYRAAMFFARTVCPERLMGMQTVEELHDVNGTQVPASEISQPEKIADQIQLKKTVAKDPAPEEAVVAKPEAVGNSDVAEEDNPIGVSAIDMRDSISDLLAQHYDGDIGKMDTVLNDIVKAQFGEQQEQVKIEHLGMFAPEHLSDILDMVEKHIGG